jgi:hypothetical protein
MGAAGHREMGVFDAIAAPNKPKGVKEDSWGLRDRYIPDDPGNTRACLTRLSMDPIAGTKFPLFRRSCSILWISARCVSVCVSGRGYLPCRYGQHSVSRLSSVRRDFARPRFVLVLRTFGIATLCSASGPIWLVRGRANCVSVLFIVGLAFPSSEESDSLRRKIY